jgi:hypothetical protein
VELLCATCTTACGAACTDTRADPNNCGACGKKCAAGFDCTNGVCVCPAPTKQCGAVCVDPAIDSKNCGGCGILCTTGTKGCKAGKCVECGVASETCTHSICVAGGPLKYRCIEDYYGCTNKICMYDKYCCQTAWDAGCVDEVKTICNLNCTC